MMPGTQKEQTTTTLKRNLSNIFHKFYRRNLRLSCLDWEPNLGDNIHHTLLSSATGLELPKALASDRASLFNRLSGFHLCMIFALRFNTSLFSIFKLIVFSMLNENIFVTLTKSEELKKIGNCCCLVLFFIKFIELGCTQMLAYLRK